MGIPKFFYWFSKKPEFSNTIGSYVPNNVDIFAIDANSLIHSNAQKQIKANVIVGNTKVIPFEMQYKIHQQIFQGIINDILLLTTTIKPTQTLIIAIDGVAPQAKINQQRSRRYKGGAERLPNVIFDTNSITPGTSFMMDLDTFLRGELEKLIKMDSPLPGEVIYSSHLVPGEGEHKIAEILRQRNPENKVVVIHGMDADLIMIYLLLFDKGWNNIYVFRENTENYKVKTIIDLKSLKTVISNLYKSKYPLDDFVILLFLLGNDFLPSFPVFERINDALDVIIFDYPKYLNEGDNLSDGLSDGLNIKWNNLAKYLNFIITHDYDRLLKLWVENNDAVIKYPSTVAEKCIIVTRRVTSETTKCDRTFDPTNFDAEWYSAIFSSKVNKGIVVPSEEEKTEMVITYLEGLIWVYKYYKEGNEAINLGWYYPYHYSPLLPDIVTVLTTKPVTWLKLPTTIFTDFVSPLEQLVMVLPPSSILEVPDPVKPLYIENSLIYDLLPSSFLMSSEGKMEKWQATVLIPIPDPIRVIRAVCLLEILPQVLAAYSFTNNLILYRDTRDKFIGNVKRGQRIRGSQRGVHRGRFIRH
jgi:5'-3' exoribonuclease 1